MAFDNNSANCVLPLMVIWLLLIHSSSYASTLVTTHIHISYKIVDAICQVTPNQEFCKTTLKNFPRTKQADMHELGVITIILATEQARLNKYVVDQLLHGGDQGADDVAKNDLSNCLSDYTVTLGKLQGAYRLSDNKGMIKLVNDAMKMTKKCEYRFQKPPTRPFPLGDNQQKMVLLNDIALATLDLLDG
ncbi:hypothetical protein Ddye_022179 [Dipteronia dyeriana]|uniref:Pectinesterase inhibitor domain-containing protein n=1 Tax=Dipteronia dyeriana TaxID=168575 RepID=A0AAD9U417_9ROSI|nr:hypothetical protein Ddye_022179 [Dipteronia dyeriana]